jgi:hypothetical protein
MMRATPETGRKRAIMQTIELRLDDETLARLRRLAEARGVSVEDLLREAIRRLPDISSADDRLMGLFADEPELLDQVVEEAMRAREKASPPRPLVFRPGQGPSTARSLLQFAGTWEGDDLEECLQLVYETRSKARF